MSTNYVLFIHGMNTRQSSYADDLIDLINPTTPINHLVVFWGDQADQKEQELLRGYRESDIWDKLWFRKLREKQLLQSAGDVALYLSRHMAAQIATKVAERMAQIEDCTEEDRLHLVTHSLGTIILFDLLFSSRWDDKGTIGHNCVMAIRKAIYGLEPNPEQGIHLGSITTMGSPIGLFSLVDVDKPAVDTKIDPSQATSTHDITPGLVRLLAYHHQELRGNKLPWRNFVHPGDPFASPLEGILPHMVDEAKMCIDIQDILVPADLSEVLSEPIPEMLLDLLAEPFRQTLIALLDSGNAHGSYWQSLRVAEGITQLIRRARAS